MPADAMWRSYLLVYPFLAVYVTGVVCVFVPLVWLSGSIRPIYWMARQGCRIALGLAGVQVRVLNGERARAHPCCVFVGNHVSNVEAPILFWILPRIAVVIKDALARIPLLGYTMRLGGFIPVNRKSKASRRQALGKAIETLKSGISMLIFPEGTRNLPGRLLPFRPGPFQMAIEAGVPVVPITIHGAELLMPRGTTYIRPGRVTLAFHPPVITTGLSQGDRLELMEQVRATMQAALDEPVP